MTPEVKPLVAGNWKMNGVGGDLSIIQSIASGYSGALQSKCDLLLCVPATLLSRASAALSNVAIFIGAQDCHPASAGAHTGDISTSMILDAGGSWVIVGHSERRTDHYETDAQVLAKASAGLAAGLKTIVCIGETAEERQSGKTLSVLERQLANSVPRDWNNGELVIAYEPVWAIGTGLTPTAKDIAEAHQFMREQLTKRFGKPGSKVRILYGGSVKPSNAEQLMAIANVDGALVGGASLKSDDFLAIATAYEKL